MLENSTILLTGGTGSFGGRFVPMTLEKFCPKNIIIYSRDEMKQWDMAQHYVDDNRVSFVIVVSFSMILISFCYFWEHLV